MKCPFHDESPETFRSANDWIEKAKECTCVGKRGSPFEFVGPADLMLAIKSGETCCDMCVGDGVPGYIYNAHQWINCPQCNANAGS